MAYWFVKSPFRSRTWAKVVAAGQFQLYGIRNAQARQAINQMKIGDEVLFYYQQTVWGVMQVTSNPFPDPTSGEVHTALAPWLAITFEPIQTLESSIPLAIIRMLPSFAKNSLLRQPRVSVGALTDKQWQELHGSR